MKGIGALFLVSACLLLGLGQAGLLLRRRDSLAGMLDALRYMNAELKNGGPIPELFSALADRAEERIRPFFVRLNERMQGFGEESLSEIWRGCVETDRSLVLKEEQRRELSRLGNYLGRYSGEEQSQALGLCMGRLEAELLSARQEAGQGMKLYTGLGLCLGLMLATVLL